MTKKKFFVTVAYPYVNGYLHLGHGVTFIKADIMVRYKKKENEWEQS